MKQTQTFKDIKDLLDGRINSVIVLDTSNGEIKETKININKCEERGKIRNNIVYSIEAVLIPNYNYEIDKQRASIQAGFDIVLLNEKLEEQK